MTLPDYSRTSIEKGSLPGWIKWAPLPVRSQYRKLREARQAPALTGNHLSATKIQLARDAGHQKRKFVGGSAKRAVDIIVASTALLVAAPMMLIVAAAVRCSMGGPVLFAQHRVGLNGHLFLCYKFRTMVLDGDEVLQRHFETNPAAAVEWRTTCKLTNDPRVTWLGLALRKASLDELPQLINVLRGDMSCVGPRPVVPTEIEQYGANQKDYFSVLPGITGLWQCSGRSKLSYSDRVALDVYYARNWSLWLDLRIMLRTVPALLRFDQSA